MLLYLLKFTAILSVLYIFYKIFLEYENMHVFKRYYLLGSVLIAFAIPFITFTNYVEIPIETLSESASFTFSHNSLELMENKSTLFQKKITIFYILGALLLLFKFFINISHLIQKISQNDKVKEKTYVHVLLEQIENPHTFFKYIFLDKQLFYKNKIPNQILIHEQTHAKQKHSIDILFIELLQIIFWFHPLIYLLKKAIKLNHEFLADNAVLKSGFVTTHYQTLLLSFANNKQKNQLANSLNYPTIKKRFKLMKTKTSKQTVWLKSLLIAPILVILIMAFSTTKLVAQQVNTQAEIIEDVILTIDGNKQIYFKDKQIALKNLSEVIANEIKHLNKNLIKQLRCTIEAKAKIEMMYIQSVSKEIYKTGIKNIIVHAPVFEMHQEDYTEVVKEKPTTLKVKADKMILKKSKKQPINKKVTLEKIANDFPKSSINSIEAIEKLPLTKETSGWVYTNNQTLFYQIKDNKLSYFNRWGNHVDKNGDEIKLPKKTKTGFIKIKGKDYYFTSKNGKKTYYDRWGYQVNHNGEKIGSERADGSRVYYNNKK